MVNIRKKHRFYNVFFFRRNGNNVFFTAHIFTTFRSPVSCFYYGYRRSYSNLFACYVEKKTFAGPYINSGWSDWSEIWIWKLGNRHYDKHLAKVLYAEASKDSVFSVFWGILPKIAQTIFLIFQIFRHFYTFDNHVLLLWFML